MDNAHPRGEDVSEGPGEGGKGQTRAGGRKDEMGDSVLGALLAQMGRVLSEGCRSGI